MRCSRLAREAGGGVAVAKRFGDWLRQAEQDLRHAHHSLEAGDHEWACFACQQAAEKALKGLYDFLGGEGWGHSVLKLLKELPRKVAKPLLEKGAYLDKLYIPARYPNGFASGAPMDYFHQTDAEEAIRHAEAILSFVQAEIRRSQRRGKGR